MSDQCLVALCHPNTKRPVRGTCFVLDPDGMIVLSPRPQLLKRQAAQSVFSSVQNWMAGRVVLLPADTAMRKVAARYWTEQCR